MIILNVLFFFKQKTAYDMRISDWSSDVCSSDLLKRRRMRFPLLVWSLSSSPYRRGKRICSSALSRQSPSAPMKAAIRSEEHTSELQSLMRISYAVFCLKKKKQQRPNPKQDDKQINSRQKDEHRTNRDNQR